MQPSELQDLPFPLGGVEEFRPFQQGRVFNGRTSAATTQSAMNIRGIDPLTGRARGGSRGGTEKYLGSQINGSEPIQDIIHLVGAGSSQVGFTGQIAQAVHPDPTPVGTQSRGFCLLTPLLSQDASSTTRAETDDISMTCWDSSGGVYWAIRDSGASKFAIVKFTTTLGFTQAWITSTFSSTTLGTILPLGMAVMNSVVYFYCATSGANTYEIWRFDASTGSNLDSGAAWKTQAAGQLSGLNNPTAATADNCLAVSNGYIAVAEMTDTSNGYVRVFNEAGTLQSGSPFKVFGPKTSGNSGWSNLIGDGEGNFYWSGFTGGEADYRVGKTTATGTTATTAPGYLMAAYSPVAKQLYALNTSPVVAVLHNDTLAKLASVSVTGATWQHVYAKPDGGVVLTLQSTTYNETVTATDANLLELQSGFPTAFNGIRARFTSVNQYMPNGADSKAYYRRGDLLVTAGGTVKLVSQTSVTDVTAGTQILWSGAPVIFSAQLGDLVYFADGKFPRFYSSITNAMGYWTESSGNSTLPRDDFGNHARLIEAWRLRLLLAGVAQNPNTIFASKVGSGTNFDFSPTTKTVSDAWQKSFDDVINCIIPYNSDKCIVGLDHSIQQITGDPTDGGGYDVLSSDVGMAWGRPYCQSIDGTIFFVGSRGGCYQLAPSSIPVSISSQSVNRDLEAIDYSSNIIRMAWDDSEQGFYLFVCPLDGSAATTHYFYDYTNRAWWPLSFASTNHNGRALYVVDGPSTGDRFTLIGCHDGYIRKFVRTATTDDGQAIASHVFIGPLINGGINEIQGTLALGSQNVTVSIHGAKSAEEAIAASAGWSGTLVSGRSYNHNPRRYSRAQYIKLATSGYWAFERLSIGVSSGTAAKHKRS